MATFKEKIRQAVLDGRISIKNFDVKSSSSGPSEKDIGEEIGNIINEILKQCGGDQKKFYNDFRVFLSKQTKLFKKESDGL